jgi:hypothetical protein
MPIPRGQLESAVRDGLVPDIFRLERAASVLESIGRRAAQINAGRGHFGELFGALQAALTTEAIMAVARLFDVPNRTYPTRCVRNVLQHLREHAADFPEILESHQLKVTLRAMHAPDHLETCIDDAPQNFCVQFADFIDSLIDDPERQVALTKLKAIRDKSLAHNEHVAPPDGPTWNAISDFAAIAKNTVGVLGWAYFRTGYMIHGEYGLTQDATRASNAATRLIDYLYAAR